MCNGDNNDNNDDNDDNDNNDDDDDDNEGKNESSRTTPPILTRGSIVLISLIATFCQKIRH